MRAVIALDGSERGIWVRPLAMFEEEIERDGKTFRRFSPITDEEAEKAIQ